MSTIPENKKKTEKKILHKAFSSQKAELCSAAACTEKDYFAVSVRAATHQSSSQIPTLGDVGMTVPSGE